MAGATHDADDGPLVSAIVIFLNEARFLAEAIESVLGQTYRRWELLLVDDGSTDGSTTIARRYAAWCPTRIRYLEHPEHANQGMSASRNLGLRHARGPLIGFLDADDVWLPEKLEQQVALLRAHPEADMVYGRTLVWQSWQGGGARDFFYDLGVPADSLVEPPRLLVQLIENRAQTPTTCNALLRAEAVRRVGGFDPRFRGMFEDQVFFMKLCARSRVFVASPCWARYRQHDGSCSARADATDGVRDARRRLLAWLARHLRDQRIVAPQVWSTLWVHQAALRWPALDPVAARSGPLLRRLRRRAGGG